MIMLQKLFNPEWQITSKSFLLSSFLIGFSFSPTAEISRLELEFEESLPQKTVSIFKEGIGEESNGAANQEKQIFLRSGYTVQYCAHYCALLLNCIVYPPQYLLRAIFRAILPQ